MTFGFRPRNAVEMSIAAICIVLIALTPKVLTPRALAESLTTGQEDWPPFISSQREDRGIAVALVQQILARKGHSFVFQSKPWNRTIFLTANAQQDFIVAVWWSAEREAKLFFSNPYLQNRLVFIQRAGDTFEYTNLDSLSGKRIGTVSKYAYGEEFMMAPHFSREATDSFIKNIKKLVAGRIDLTLADQISATTQILDHDPDIMSKIRFSQRAYRENNLHFACSRLDPKCPALIDDFNTELAAMKADGSYEAFFREQGLSGLLTAQ